LVLDEIGELPLASQAKLLRALEERRFERVGSSRSLPLEARVIAATNRDLKTMVAEGKFRSDLFFRVSVVTVRVPSLRERGEDVVLIAKRVLSDLAATCPRRIEGFTPKALESLRRYTWPGNVRELRNVLERALVLGEGPRIDDVDLPESIRAPDATPAADALKSVQLPARLDWLEQRAIETALEATGGNRTRAAALLGINRQTLYNKLGEKPGDR
jgi:two-component system response regulator HydG